VDSAAVGAENSRDNEIVAVRLSLWDWYQQNREAIAPLLAPLGSLAVGFGTIAVGGLVAWAALRQARTATRQAQIATQVAEIANRQAEIASQRHEAQTKADQHRRITESFSKAVEQLANDKIEMRLGGIYTLERISLGKVLHHPICRPSSSPVANRSLSSPRLRPGKPPEG
jgi:hypothetical protein